MEICTRSIVVKENDVIGSFVVVTDCKKNKKNEQRKHTDRSNAVGRQSKNEGRETKLPPTACSVAYRRGSESAKQVLIKCCQHWRRQTALRFNKMEKKTKKKKRGVNPYRGMNLANKHKKNESVVCALFYYSHKVAPCVAPVSNHRNADTSCQDSTMSVPAEWQKVPEATPHVSNQALCAQGRSEVNTLWCYVTRPLKSLLVLSGLSFGAGLIRDDLQHIGWQLGSFLFVQPSENFDAGVILAALASPLTVSSARLFATPLNPSSSFSVWLMLVWCNFCYQWWMFLFFGVLPLLLPVYLRIAKQKPFSRSLKNGLTSCYHTFFFPPWEFKLIREQAEDWVSPTVSSFRTLRCFRMLSFNTCIYIAE